MFVELKGTEITELWSRSREMGTPDPVYNSRSRERYAVESDRFVAGARSELAGRERRGPVELDGGGGIGLGIETRVLDGGEKWEEMVAERRVNAEREGRRFRLVVGDQRV
jgi:hypothetical protein